ncbi:CoA-transferase family III domain-containing protein [Microdochium bolleyi]|uniref:CoA-transferase family III domain-containing protein n=1 Tax=Microdochium bolleyi TaxID=196109 RepID=A0A136IQC0_9PEZI|nr:CoA-transferase family III domain-containing protein [Microdochium bolleyi]
MSAYSVPKEARKLLLEGIVGNPLVTPHLPAEIAQAADKVSFTGSDEPSIPINWRFAEGISALKGLEASLLSVLLKKRYGADFVDVAIDTDHAQLFIMSSLLWTIDPEGENLSARSVLSPEGRKKIDAIFPSWDKADSQRTLVKQATTNIYKTKDGRYFHLHGSLDPVPSLKAVGVSLETECASQEASWAILQDAVGQLDAAELQHRATDVYKQAGTICYTMKEFKESEHGKTNAHVSLFELEHHPDSENADSTASQPTWWPSTPQTSPRRPLAGLKVVDLTRIIAGPAISRGLAELGASVMRVVGPHLPDFSALHPDLNHGKWNACLDLREESDREKLRELVLDADVFLQGYRPGVLEKYGFGEKDVIEMCKGRTDRGGIIYVAENCYGFYGPWQGRSGWQQISDANVGVSYEFGRAMGVDEPVTPVFPNSDYCTGVAGVSGVLAALVQRADKGGAYTVKVALNYYSQWLVNSCGVYPPEIWQDLWTRNGRPQYRHFHAMQYTLPATMQLIMKSSAARLLKPDHFTTYYAKSIGKPIKIVAPVLRFPGGEVEPGFQVGTRTNGVDEPYWPDDLLVETVAKKDA